MSGNFTGISSLCFCVGICCRGFIRLVRKLGYDSRKDGFKITMTRRRWHCTTVKGRGRRDVAGTVCKQPGGGASLAKANATVTLNRRPACKLCLQVRAVYKFKAMKTEILDYIRAHPGCTSTSVNKAVREDRSWADWINTRNDIDNLIKEGLVRSSEENGITLFYLTDKAV